MPASPAPADPGRDDDLAWLDRDPMTAAERQASLDRLCERDEGHPEDEADQYGDFIPLTSNAPDPGRRGEPGSRSPRPAGTGRPAATAPGGCAPPDPDPA
jgi:hypothetical protein